MSDITKLRSILFDQLDALADKSQTVDLDRTRAINEIAKTMIDSAKVENDNMRITGSKGSGFLPAPEIEGGSKVSQIPGGRVITHRLAG